MVSKRDGVKFPPDSEWDDRMREAQCKNLQPITELHQNDWFTVRNRNSFYTVEYREPQVIILPILDKKNIIMVGVKRPVIDDISLELPAGGIESGESAEEAALRELSEETGIHISEKSRLIAMAPLSESPNRIPQLIYVFRINISKEEFNNRTGHDDEIEYISTYTFHEVIKKLYRGKIYVAVPAAIIGMYLLSMSWISK